MLDLAQPLGFQEVVSLPHLCYSYYIYYKQCVPFSDICLCI